MQQKFLFHLFYFFFFINFPKELLLEVMLSFVVKYQRIIGNFSLYVKLANSVPFVSRRCNKDAFWTISVCTQFPLTCVIPRQGVFRLARCTDVVPFQTELTSPIRERTAVSSDLMDVACIVRSRLVAA